MTTFAVGIVFFILSLFTINIHGSQFRKWAVCIVCFIMIFQAGSRDYKLSSNDTLNYEMEYIMLRSVSWSEIISSFNILAESYEDRDKGFTVFVKTTQMIYDDFRFFLYVVAIIISVPVCILLYRFVPTTAGVFFAALIYESIFASFFMTGIRQTIAMGMVYSSIPLLLKRKYIWHYLIVIIAYTIHSTALIFVPVGFLLKHMNPKLIIRLSVLLVPFFMVFAAPIVAYVGQGTIFESYAIGSTDNMGTPVFSALVVFLTLMLSVFLRSFCVTYPESSKLLIITISMSCCLMPTSWVDSNFIRLVFFYLLFMIYVVPMMIECLSRKSIFAKLRIPMYLVIGSGLLFLMGR